jgi:hypothetical protein
VVDDQIGGDQWIDHGWITTKVSDSISHSREVDDRGHAGEVLEDDPGRHERDLGINVATRPPAGEDLDVRWAHETAASMPKNVFEQHAKRDWAAIQIEPIGQDGKSVVVGKPCAEAGSRAEWIGLGHRALLAREGSHEVAVGNQP